jgi:hypothetical protein
MVRVSVLAVVVFLIAGAVPAFSSTSGSDGKFVLTRVHMTPGAAAHPATAAPHPLLVARPALYQREKAAANAGYQRWLKLHPAKTTTARTGPLTSVSGSLDQPGLDSSDPSTANTPPDTTGAVGPSNYVEMVNSEIGVYDKTDLSAPTATLDQPSFVGDPTAGTCDGQIQWDQQAQRWLYAAIECDQNFTFKLYFGWSKTASPDLSASNWCQYAADTGLKLEDYPKLGHDYSQILIGTNEFDYGTGDFNSNVFVFDKPTNNADTSCPNIDTEGLSAAVLTVGSWPESANQPTGAFTPVPANIADTSSNGYVVATDWDSSHVDVFTIGRDGSDNALLDSTSVSVPAFCYPPAVPQAGSSVPLDSLDGRLTQAVATTDPDTGDEGIWTQQTVSQGCSSGVPSGPSVVRWYELTPGAISPTQTGTVNGPDGSFAFMGAISPSSDGQNAAIFYNSSSDSSLPDFRVQDRHRYTTGGTTIEDLQLGTSSYTDDDDSCSGDGVCRWGDYAAATPDPTDSTLVWGTGEVTSRPFNILAPFPHAQWGSLNAAIDVTPAANYTLDVTAANVRAGTGSVTSGDAIIDCPGTCSHTYAYNTPVELTATPGAHTVVTWSGDCSGSQPTCDLPLGGPQSAIATFSPLQEPLGYTASGNGSGSVGSSPTGLSCGASCARTFDYGTSVELTATPATGSTFSGWSGDCTVVNGKCDVSMQQSHAVTATFTLVPENLAVSKAGSGSGTVASTTPGISCGTTCSSDFNYGTTVTLTATPAIGSVFTGWAGAGCSGTGTCTILMTADRAPTATFALLPEALTVTKIGSGSGTVTSDVAGISCGSTCSHAYDYGTSVTLTATPASNATFVGWSGACSGAGQCTVPMTAAATATATFAEIVCVVPKLKGKTVSAAKAAVTQANCSVGKITKKTSAKVKKGRVISQSQAPGKHLTDGARVGFVVSKGRSK